ncbi:hypothetical protein GCM10022225_54280 [Plantactinospora mayteni]|uniref:PH domain-containing protein n=1 Tax=Plantactinospora mayteni TaxID=566021 RepID=A0ABQ4EJW8_9ACTN|nr:hypothetical protein [Plantactinospora mayteni]GIG95046.1 hypothetical protein Pma05_16190 [Plantactinospora mayteni]
MTQLRFGPAGGPRYASYFAIAVVPFALVVTAMAGWQAASGEGLRPLALATLVTSLAGVLVAVGLLLAERRSRAGRSAGPDGIRTGRQGVLGWARVGKLSLHAGAGDQRLLAAWPTGARTPVWLGSVDRADVPAEEAIRLVEQWSGRQVERA